MVKCHAGCSREDILDELRRRGMVEWERCHRAQLVPAVRKTELFKDRGAESRIETARRIWVVAEDARGSPVARYLARRGITIPIPPSLRWAPRCWHRDARAWLPAIVARVDGLDGKLIGVHRTYLDREATGQWHRRDRASLGPIGGGAVRLAPAAETLMIGEGIETCLAAMQATVQPAWAALSTSGIAALLLPPSVRTVIILADNDANGAGERAAWIAAQRWLAEGRRVRIALPPDTDTDFNDVLLGRAHARIGEVRNVAA